MQKMAKIKLGLSKLPEPPDVADALAVALCHISQLKAS
jgi:Holliday junction resolvasome RuvABC endonuclease subunit